MAYFEVAVLILYYCNMRCVLRTCLPIGRTWRVAEWHHDVSVGLRTWNFREAIHTPAFFLPPPPPPPASSDTQVFYTEFCLIQTFPTNSRVTHFSQSIDWHTDNFYKTWWNTIFTEPVVTHRQYLQSLVEHNFYRACRHTKTFPMGPCVAYKHYQRTRVTHISHKPLCDAQTISTEPCKAHKYFLWALIFHTHKIAQALVWHTNIFQGNSFDSQTVLTVSCYKHFPQFPVTNKYLLQKDVEPIETFCRRGFEKKREKKIVNREGKN